MKRIISMVLILVVLIPQLAFAQANDKRQLRDEKFDSFVQTLQGTSIQVMSYEQLKGVAEGYKVIVLGGYSGLGYENPQNLRIYIKELMRKTGNQVIYVIGGTEAGIGEAYNWIPEIANEIGLQNIKTAGIVSRNAVEYGIANQDYIVFVDTAIDNWEVKENGKSLMVNIAADTNGTLVYFKGGVVSREEIQEALESSVNVIIVNHPEIAPNAKNVAKKLAANPQYIVDGTELFIQKSQQFPTLKIVSEAAF